MTAPDSPPPPAAARHDIFGADVAFNSWQFLLFFPVVVLVFFRLAPPVRRWWLLAASVVFYMAFVPEYILVALSVILLNFHLAQRIQQAPATRRRAYLIAGVSGTLAILAAFKYLSFIAENVAALASALGLQAHRPELAILLPLGLSFQTFQSLSYLLEVYHGRQTPEPSLATYALYVLFFPLQVAGPIERPQHLLPQLSLDAPFDPDRLTAGLKLMAWGLFKKMVLADRLALVVSTVYANPESFSGPQLTMATVMFAFQVYYDFSGYTDVARGAARVLGIDLHFNFNRPHAARFVGDFWGRWHVSLTSWFRDYVYAPMAGRRPKPLKRMLAVWAVFLLSGLWHGAAWHFVVWGGIHAAYLSVGTATAIWRSRAAQAIGLARVPRAHAVLKVLVTFSLVSLAWIFFRAADVGSAVFILSRLGTGWSSWTAGSLDQMGIGLEAFRLLVVVIAVVEVASWLDSRHHAAYPLAGRWAPMRALGYAGIVIGILEFGVVETVPFIYLQF